MPPIKLLLFSLGLFAIVSFAEINVSVSAQTATLKPTPTPRRTPAGPTGFPTETLPIQEYVRLPKYSESEIDLTADALPSQYIGHDIRKIAREIYRREHLRKDEFEKTDQFNERVRAAKAMPLAGTSIRAQTILAMVLKASFAYNADEEVMHGTIDSFRESLDRGAHLLPDPASRKIIGTGVRTKFNVPVEAAKLLKPSLAAIAIIRLKVRADGNYFPVRKSEEPLGGVEEDLEYEFLQLWLFNKETGDILGKIDRTELQKVDPISR